jgi:hypothetical protein
VGEEVDTPFFHLPTTLAATTRSAGTNDGNVRAVPLHHFSNSGTFCCNSRKTMKLPFSVHLFSLSPDGGRRKVEAGEAVSPAGREASLKPMMVGRAMVSRKPKCSCPAWSPGRTMPSFLRTREMERLKCLRTLLTTRSRQSVEAAVMRRTPSMWRPARRYRQVEKEGEKGGKGTFVALLPRREPSAVTRISQVQ